MESRLLKHELDTPCLILDLDILEENLRKMQNLADDAGKNLRPHVKTHKCSTLARKQIETGAIGICAAKISEAEGLAEAGIENVLITGPAPTPIKMKRLAALVQKSPSTMIVLDHPTGVDLLSEALEEKRLSMNVLIDLDVGLHRTGVIPKDAPDLAKYVLSKHNLKLRGFQAYAGQVQHISDYEEREAASKEALKDAAAIFSKMNNELPGFDIFSTSGTGTFDIDLAIPEITELQVGSYACMDVEYMSIGSAKNPHQFDFFRPALRLLTSVISVNQEEFITVDAGLKSLYKHGGIPEVLGKSGLTYSWFGDEYGKITAAGNGMLPSTGDVLEMAVSHCDPTINLFDEFYIIRGKEVLDTWPVDLRGCSH